MPQAKRKMMLLKACKSDVKSLLRDIPPEYWPNSRFILLCMLYPVSGGKEQSLSIEKELLRVYLTGVIDIRLNSGELIKALHQ